MINQKNGKHYLLFALIGGIVLFLVFSLVLYQQYRSSQLRSELTQQTYEAIMILKRIELNYINMETGVRGYLLTGRNSFLDPYNESRGKQKELYSMLLAQLDSMPWVKADLPTLLKAGESFENMLAKQVQLLTIGDESAITKTILQAQKLKADNMRELMDTFGKELLRTLKSRISSEGQEKQDYIYTLFIGGILVIGGMAAMHLFVLSLMAKAQFAEEKLQYSEKLFRDVMNGINDGVFDYDIIHNMIQYSPTYISMLGYNERDNLTSVDSLIDLVHPDDKEKVLALLEQFRHENSTTYRAMFRMRHKDGSWRWILSRAVGVRDKQNKLVRMMGSHSDITTEKKREAELIQLSKDIESFTYIASHDLRSPLVNLKGFSGEIQHALAVIHPLQEKMLFSLQEDEHKRVSTAINEDIPEALRFIQQAVGRMDKLTSAILELSRIGRQVYRTEKIDCNALVLRCIESMAYETNRKNAEISVLGDLPEVYSDPAALEQVIANIIDNAIKYLDPKRKGRITISAKKDTHRVLFRVEDNGRGISEKDYHKVFEIFRRARNTSDVSGHGIGMAYVKATLRKLGGEIYFNSKSNAGTVFFFTIPSNPPENEGNGYV